MLSGIEKPDGGEIRVGPSVKLAYVDQSRQALNDKNTVWQEISGGLDLIKVGNYRPDCHRDRAVQFHHRDGVSEASA